MRRIYIIPFLFFIDLLVFCYFLYPQWLKIDNLKGNISILEQNLKNKNEYYQKIQDISAKIKNHSNQLEKIDLALPDNPSLPALFNFFQQNASANGLMVSGISGGGLSGSRGRVRASKSVSNIKKASISLNLVGQLDSLEAFLKTIELSARMIEIQNLNISLVKQSATKIGVSNSSAKENPLNLKIVLSILVPYYQK